MKNSFVFFICLFLCAFMQKVIVKDSIKNDNIGFDYHDLEAFGFGVLRGLKLEDNVDDIIRCLYNDAFEYLLLLQELLTDLEHIDIKHLSILIDAVKKIFEIVELLLKDLKPCSKDVKKIEKFIYELEHENPEEIALRVLLHGGKILQDLVNIPKAWEQKDYLNLGIDIGDFCYLTLVK